MTKVEILYVHRILYQIKQMLKEAGYNKFQAYDALGVLPTHLQLEKSKHEKAVILLCEGILDILKLKEKERLLSMLKEK